MPTRHSEGLRLRRLLLLGYAGIFLIWLLSAYMLTQRMLEADTLGAEIRTRFLHNDQMLSTVRAQVLLSSVYLRDALLDTEPGRIRGYRDQLQTIRREVETALDGYVPGADSLAEREQWVRLRQELGEYWQSTLPVLEIDRTPSAGQARSTILQDVIPRRETIIRVSDRIHALNQSAFQQAQGEVAALREGLRTRVWQTSAAAVMLGLVVAFFATRHAGLLEARIREQRAQEDLHKDELELLSSKLMQAQEDERRRIARELHDEIGQALSAIKLELAVAESQGGAATPSRLAEARSITDGALQAVRDISQMLHPAMLDDLGLPDTTNWYLGGFTRRTGIKSELVIRELDDRIAPELEVCTYRIIQEAVTNVARHAEATHCRVEIAGSPRSLHLTIEDNGKGFEPRAVPGAGGRGLGLVSVRERVARLGGTLLVDSHLGQGTRLTVELPIHQPGRAA